MREPKLPLVKLSAAFTSGKRGTHDMIPKPKRKKRARSLMSSALASRVFMA
jgi:hypothetical protein